jgi:putative addiction module component (TIGR02574 family)
MSSVEHRVFDAALALPEAARARLAEVLLDSLPEESDDAPLSEPLPDAWIEEIRRRLAEIEDGRATLLPGEEVIRRLKRGK